MKKLLTLLLVTCLLLCACGGKTEPVPTTTAEPTVAETTTEATTEATTAAPTEAVIYRHPLTGEPLDAPFSGRPVAVSLGNTKSALPQTGISKADVFFEIEAEGDITRFLSVFTDYSDIKRIGPIRSARSFFNSAAASLDATIIHCGGSPRGISGYHDLTGSKISDWSHIDQMYNGNYFYRDSARKSAGYAHEHTLFVTGEKLQAAMTDKKYTENTVTDYGYQFAEDADLQINGTTANKIVVTFLGTKTSTFEYDSATGLYAMSQYKQKLIDGDTNTQMTFKNLIVLYAKQTKKNEGYYTRSYYDLLTTGDGYFAVNGQIVPIKWSRNSLTDAFTYTLEDGTPITMGVGNCYVGISSTKSSEIKYE